VNVRTAYRDLDFLRDEWRVPLEFDRASLLAAPPSRPTSPAPSARSRANPTLRTPRAAMRH